MFLKHFSVFQYSKIRGTSMIVGIKETSYHADLGKNNLHQTEGETSIGEEQFGFMPDRGPHDAIFAVRQVIEKHREMQNCTWCLFTLQGI